MNKATFLSNLTTLYKDVGSAVLNPSGPTSPPNTNWYVVTVLEAGTAADSSPIATEKNVYFYVYGEGTGSETAYSFQVPQANSCDPLSTSATGGQSYYNLYSSPSLRNRVIGAMIKSAVYFVNGGTVNQSFHWGQDYIKDPSKYLDAMMCELSSNGAIRAAGNATLDADLEYAIGTYIPTVATAFGIVS